MLSRGGRRRVTSTCLLLTHYPRWPCGLLGSLLMPVASDQRLHSRAVITRHTWTRRDIRHSSLISAAHTSYIVPPYSTHRRHDRGGEGRGARLREHMLIFSVRATYVGSHKTVIAGCLSASKAVSSLTLKPVASPPGSRPSYSNQYPFDVFAVFRVRPRSLTLSLCLSLSLSHLSPYIRSTLRRMRHGRHIWIPSCVFTVFSSFCTVAAALSKSK